LADIKRKRQAKNPGDGGKNLDSLRREAISQIEAELGKQPTIDESELTNQN